MGLLFVWFRLTGLFMVRFRMVFGVLSRATAQNGVRASR